MAVGLEGTRSYGVGLARAVATAGLLVAEGQAARRADRRHRGKSDPGDAHLAALQVLRRQAEALPVPVLTVTGKPCGSCSARAAK